MLAPSAIIAAFINEERTVAYELRADGSLSVMQRNHRTDIWSASETVAHLERATEGFESFINSLTQEA